MRAITTLSVALLLSATITAPSHGCGGYGSIHIPLDSVVQAALSHDTVLATRAYQQLRKLGNEGIERVRMGIWGEEMKVHTLQRQIAQLDRAMGDPRFSRVVSRTLEAARARRELPTVRANIEALKLMLPLLERDQRANAIAA